LIHRFAYINLTATEVSALTSTFKFYYDPAYLRSVNYPLDELQWTFGLNTDPAVWVGLALVGILLINFLPVRAYGEIEYVFGCLKMIVISGIIMMQIILNARNANGDTDEGPFTYYQSPWGFFSNQVSVTCLAESPLLVLCLFDILKLLDMLGILSSAS
jgi:amino acid transporter